MRASQHALAMHLRESWSHSPPVLDVIWIILLRILRVTQLGLCPTSDSTDPPLSRIMWSPNSIGQKHREIAKGCPQYISSVVKCVKLFLPNDFCQKGIKMWICVNEFCNNYCFWVFTVEFLCFVTNWAFVLYHNLRFWVLSQFVLLSCWIKKNLVLSQFKFISPVEVHNKYWESTEKVIKK